MFVYFQPELLHKGRGQKMARRTGSLRRKNLLHKIENSGLPGNLSAKNPKRNIRCNDRLYIVLVDIAVCSGKERGHAEKVWDDSIHRRGKTVKEFGINKNAAVSWQLQLFFPNPCSYGSGLNIHKFQLRMPVPVYAVKIKLG